MTDPKVTDDRKRVAQIEEEHARLDGAHVIPAIAKRCRICFLLSHIKSLEGENGRLKERAAKTTVAEIAEQARLINERDDLQSRLNATEEKIRKMIEALELVLAHPVSGETLGTILYNVIEYYRALAEEGKGEG